MSSAFNYCLLLSATVLQRLVVDVVLARISEVLSDCNYYYVACVPPKYCWKRSSFNMLYFLNESSCLRLQIYLASSSSDILDAYYYEFDDHHFGTCYCL